MNTPRKREANPKNGSVLLIAVVMLGFASFIVGSIFTATITYTRNSELVYSHDKAAFLADAGLHAAVVALNTGVDRISYDESRAYFSQTAAFTQPDWGFSTELTLLTNGNYRLQSTGRANGNLVVAQSEITRVAGSNSVHALYAHAIFAGNSSGLSNYVLQIGGTGTGADFVRGDAYSGNKIELTGAATLRHPEILVDTNGDDICAIDETWTNSYAVQVFTNPLSQADFNTYKAAQSTNTGKIYTNGKYDFGEAFVDTIGDGVYTMGEPFTDLNGNGRWDAGDAFVDRNSNGVYNAGVDTVVDNGNGRWDAGEEWVEDTNATRSVYRKNGKYDPVKGYWSGTTWKTTYKVGKTTYNCTNWPAEQFMDVGDGVYSPAEAYVDQNGVYDFGEQFVDDRNDLYDYGTQAKGTITGMPAPGPGQRAANGNNNAIRPPDLTNMFYGVNRNSTKPANALSRWGNDVIVSSNNYGTAKAIVDVTKPQHIFVRNPPTSGSVTVGGKTINGRSYTAITNASGQRLDDYFFEDPADATYNTTVASLKIGTAADTAPMLINVAAADNNKLYFVDGNVYIHHPNVMAMRFRNPNTRITIVANGNITISDEFYYNASYSSTLAASNINSTIVNSPSDVLCFIALKNPNFPTNTGNIKIGDAQFGTGGSIHAMLYAENDFIDNNLNTSGQPFISIFGNMTAGNQVRLNRPTSGSRTRLDVTLDDRVRDGSIIIPGIPHPLGQDRPGRPLSTAWGLAPGTWNSYSILK